MTNDILSPDALTPEQFSRLGAGAIAYVRPIASQDVSRIF
ncbi:MAG: DUF1150 family protein, partial [Hyphomicrobiales bacterium]|nr:DUF1150 family protein [Hyphomicrobiales bacterium]